MVIHISIQTMSQLINMWQYCMLPNLYMSLIYTYADIEFYYQKWHATEKRMYVFITVPNKCCYNDSFINWKVSLFKNENVPIGHALFRKKCMCLHFT